MPSKAKILSGDWKTKSKIPKTPKQKAMWKRGVEIAVKTSGKSTDKTIPFPLVTTIYKNEVKAGKVAKKSDVTKAKYSKTVAKYSNNSTKGKKR